MSGKTSYKPEYCEKMIKYFNIEPYKKEKLKKTNKDGSIEEKLVEIANDLPLLSGFATYIGVHRDTLHYWSTKFTDFSDAYKKAKEIQRKILITNGLRGNYQTAFAIFTAKNLTDMRDKQEIEHSGELTIKDAKEIATSILGKDDETPEIITETSESS
jgi:hypothetical protein